MTKRYTLGDSVDNMPGMFWLMDDGHHVAAAASQSVICNISDACDIYGGHFYGGEFHDGLFHGGYFYGGEFFDGIFHSGRQECSIYSGVFNANKNYRFKHIYDGDESKPQRGGNEWYVSETRHRFVTI